MSWNKFSYLGRKWVLIFVCFWWSKCSGRGVETLAKETGRLNHQPQQVGSLSRDMWLKTSQELMETQSFLWLFYKYRLIHRVSRTSCSISPAQLNTLWKITGINRKRKYIQSFQVLSHLYDYISQEILSLKLFELHFCDLKSRESGLIRAPTTTFTNIPVFKNIFWFPAWNMQISHFLKRRVH